MKQILPQLKQLTKHLSFLRKGFTKRGFRHATAYINGLITLNKKTIKQISKACVESVSESSLNRFLGQAQFKQGLLEERYLKKIKYFTQGQEISLVFDDTLVKREGKHIEETQRHKNHSGEEKFITGHQFFTSMVHTPLLQLPLFPKLYSKNTDSKIQMALDLINTVIERLPLDTVMMDSWYSDKKIMKKCMTKGVRVVTVIKTNRNVREENGEWENLKEFSQRIPKRNFIKHFIDEGTYKIAEYEVKLKGVPFIKMIVSKEKYPKKQRYKDSVHLISTIKEDRPIQIIRCYDNRWIIETYHRDMKQNLGFASPFVRKKQGIVRHAIFAALAYAVLRLYLFCNRIKMTVGECITYIQNKGMDDFLQEIIEIEDTETRLAHFREVFIRETGEV